MEKNMRFIYFFLNTALLICKVLVSSKINRLRLFQAVKL
jgi:hypothetical protein